MSTTEEIALLEYRMQAYIARTSMLQSRLLSTRDTLDVLERTHQEELSSITAERDGMKMELQRYIDIVESAKSDQKDMRDAVMKLIEKVELSNDYSVFPHSKIYLSSLAVDAPTPWPSSREPSDNEENSLSYAASLIEILRKQRDSERVAHTRTRDLADREHAALRAMLSIRDAELESCIASAEHQAAVAAADGGRERGHIPFEYEPISRDEVVSVLEARNKILEKEVRILATQVPLEEARRARRRTPTSAGPSTNYATHLNPNDTFAEAAFGANRLKERPIKSSSSDQLIGLENQINELGLKIDAFAAERKAIAQSVGLAALQVEPILENPHQPSNELDLPLQRECDRLRRRETELRDQLNETRMDAQEREADLLAEISALRQQLQQRTPNYAEVGVETEPTPFSLLRPVHSENLLEANEGEQSMELATPLMPTSVLPTHFTEPDDVHMLQHGAHSSPPSPYEGNSTSVGQIRQDGYLVDPASEIESPYVDPPTIPLPHSPELELEGMSAWEENSPSDYNISALDFPIPPGFPYSMPGRSNTFE